MKTGKKLLAVLCLALIACMAAQVAMPAGFAVMTNAQAAASVKLNKTKATLYVGETVQLSILHSSKKVSWSSSNKSVAKVSKTGLVTAKKAGQATITAKVGDQSFACKVTVKAALYAKKTNLAVKVGTPAKVRVYNYSDGAVTVKSGNADIATAAFSGDWSKNRNYLVITGKKAGVTSITLKNSKTKETARINVAVVDTPKATLEQIKAEAQEKIAAMTAEGVKLVEEGKTLVNRFINGENVQDALKALRDRAEKMANDAKALKETLDKADVGGKLKELREKAGSIQDIAEKLREKLIGYLK